MSGELLRAALAYAGDGWPVFPLGPGRKTPAISKEQGGNGYLDATTDERTIREWWSADPRRNIGVATGPAGLFVVDIDPRHGGDESLLDLREQHGDEWMGTVTAITPSGGTHFYFAMPPGAEVGCSVGIFPGIDIRSTGGYVAAPPSRRSDGEYGWAAGLGPGETPLLVAPGWIVTLPTKTAAPQERSGAFRETIPLGARNTTLTSLAGTMHRRGLAAEEMVPTLLAVNDSRCEDPLPASEVVRIADSVERYPAARPLVASGGPFKLTDLGNAERLVARHGAELRFCRPWRRWLTWDGHRWAADLTGRVEQLAKDTVRAIYAEAAESDDEDRRKAVARHAQRSEGDRAVMAMLSRAESEPAFAVEPRDFDQDIWLLNCLNGTLDLRTGMLREHRRDDLITKLAPVEYHPEVRLQRWDDFVAFVTGGDIELIEFLRRFFGYCLSGSVEEEKLAFVHGPGATGKSTFIEAIKAVLGDYAVTADFETFLARKATGGPRPDIARLAGARLVTSIEVDDGKKLAEGLVKQVTGGDTVSARRLYAEEFEFVPQFKLVLVANHAPTVHADDDAIWRRILRVPFDNAIPQAKQDKSVKAILKDPAIAGPAVLSWLVEGHRRWRAEGLAIPSAVAVATEEYRSDMDQVADFFAARLEFEPAAAASSSDIFRCYKVWADENGVTDLVSIQRLGERLKTHGCRQARRHGGTRIWKGVGVPGWAERFAKSRTVAGDEGDGGDEQFQKPPSMGPPRGTFGNPPSPLSPLSP